VQAERLNANAAITYGTIRVIVALQWALDESNRRKDNGYVAPFLSTNPAVGSKLAAEPARGVLVETAS
jgi:hypothetical protein